MDKNRLNGSGCRDDTAYEAMKSYSQKTEVSRYNRTQRDEDADELVWILKRIVKRYGFCLTDRIRFEDPATGRKYV